MVMVLVALLKKLGVHFLVAVLLDKRKEYVYLGQEMSRLCVNVL